ncbi:Mu transposase C-terminal domain-containing protein [Syntrophaceticus schinkii]|jgi:hypothetical protein|nr:Mu transposase C-terminal domain-containing protein [Syntrophaceticus schinkii]
MTMTFITNHIKPEFICGFAPDMMPSGGENVMNDISKKSKNKNHNEAMEIAHLRFAVIAPVIQGVFTEPTKTAYYKKVAEKPLKMPDGRSVFLNYNTFEKWEASYKRKGMDGLIPKARCDIGMSRVLPNEAIDEIYRLIQQFPRINATLIYTKQKNTWLNGFDLSQVNSLEDLNRLLADYVRMRNNSVNRNTGETPMERYSRHIDRIRFPQSRAWLDECFMSRIIRKVNNDATVSIDSVMYDVPMQFIRSKVEIRYLPDDMKNAYILHQGKRYPIRRTNKLENSRTKREKLPSIDYSLNGGFKDV